MKQLFTILFLISCLVTNATDHTVSSVEGFNAAMQKVVAGDIIIWKNGIYIDTKISFKPNVNGIPNLPIYLKAESAGKVVFKGSSIISINGDHLQVEGFLFEGTSTLDKDDVLAFSQNSNHCRITNCAVIDYTPNNLNANNNWISLQGIHNEVDHCYFKGKTNQGPYLVVRYKTGKDFITGSDIAPSTHHYIHHNYFGFRTLPSDNGGEDIRIGDSKTSFTHGFNIIEYNYFEDQRLEAEIISNKSWNNIYRFNTFIANDGAMVLRHGQKCFVYGNYLDGKTGRNKSGGLRVINANQTVFNNYVVNVEASQSNALKAGIVIMSGLENSEINGYYAADSAIVAYNTLVNCAGPVIKVGVGNKSKGQNFIAPKDISIVSNLAINSIGQDSRAISEYEKINYLYCKNNVYTNGGNLAIKGFDAIKEKQVQKHNGFFCYDKKEDEIVIKMINERLAIHNIHLKKEDIMHYNPKWKLEKKDVGVSWMN